MLEPIMKKVKGDGIEINLAIWEGAGKPILCVHGITANCRCWDVMAAALTPEYRLIAMDLRGRGQSDKPSKGYSLAHHLRDIQSIFDDIGMDRAAVMGHSLGAFIALAFGAQYPDRVDSLILVDGGGDLSQQQFLKVFEAIKPSLERLGQVFSSTEDYLNKMRKSSYIHPWSDAIDTYYRYELEDVKGGVRANIDPAHIKEEAANIGKVRSASFYPRIQSKTLILRAPNGLISSEDLLLPEDIIERMIREIPDVRRFDVEGVNHYGIVFQPHPGRDHAIHEFLKH